MEEIELSVMGRRLANSEVLNSLIDTFQTQQRVQVQLQTLNWAVGRPELTRVALYHHGPDVSEIGTTWVSDLVAMNALRPFSPAEIDQFGGAGSFLPAAWKSTHMAGDTQTWGIPWLAESLILHYRKDLLQAAGIDESSAFSTPNQLFDTVQRLKQAGYELPIALPPSADRNLLLHIAATWVWQAGGSFMSLEGSQVSFNEAAALSGFQSFFRLLHSLPPEGLKQLAQLGIADSFYQGRAPLAIAGPWLHPSSAPVGSVVSASEWGVTRLPGPPFVGGSNLVIWKHTRLEKTALALIRYLTSKNEGSRYAAASGILPATVQALSASQPQADPILQTMYLSVQTGQSFPNLPLWGLIEDRLSITVAGIWENLVKNPQQDVDEVVANSLNRLARSLNLTLSQR